jgi:hypothetical protein
MHLDRRAALAAALGLGVAGAARAQTQSPPPAPPSAPPVAPSLAERINAAALQNRRKLDFDGARFSGPAWDALVEAGRDAQFFLIGEEHGIAENPKLAAQLFSALRHAGYEHVCVEISPPMAGELDRAARGGVEGVRAMFADPRANVAFFGMREEAEWIAAVRAAAPARGQAVWGIDYEVGADRRLIQMLTARRKPDAAETALAALEAASNASWEQYAQTHNPQFIFSFAGDPALVAAVRQAWPNADADAALILETLEETLAINKLWVSNQGWASNQRRAEFNRRNIRRFRAQAPNSRVLFKMGASHMVRGLSHTQVFDIGNEISEAAEAMGARSFHVMVLPGAGSRVAQFDPSAWTYRAGDAETYADQGMTPLMSAAYPDAFTLIDLRAIRPLVFGARHKPLDPDLVRSVHGFDALLVMSGSSASSNL